METLGPALTRWVLYGAVSILIGAALFHWLVLARSASPSPERKAAIRRSVAQWALWASLALLVSLVGVLWWQFRDFHDPLFDPWQTSLRILVLESLWGKIWMAQLGLAVLTAVASLLVRRSPTGGTAWGLLAVAAFASAAMPAFSGHSFGAERLETLAITFDVVHLWGAGGWIGLLTVLFLSARRHRDRDPDSRGTVHEWVRAFSPVALASFGALILTGIFASWLHVGSIELYFSTGYGRTLLTKLAVIAGVAALGFYNWKHVTPRLDSEEGEARFLGFSAPTEVVLGLLVLLVTALLVGTALPMESMSG